MFCEKWWNWECMQRWSSLVHSFYSDTMLCYQIRAKNESLLKKEFKQFVSWSKKNETRELQQLLEVENWALNFIHDAKNWHQATAARYTALRCWIEGLLHLMTKSMTRRANRSPRLRKPRTDCNITSVMDEKNEQYTLHISKETHLQWIKLQISKEHVDDNEAKVIGIADGPISKLCKAGKRVLGSCTAVMYTVDTCSELTENDRFVECEKDFAGFQDILLSPVKVKAKHTLSTEFYKVGKKNDVEASSVLTK